MMCQADDREFLLRVSYMEIYNEEINDLLAPENRKLQVHENLEVCMSFLFLHFCYADPSSQHRPAHSSLSSSEKLARTHGEKYLHWLFFGSLSLSLSTYSPFRL